MAVQLKDDGRYPAPRKVPAEQFSAFVEDCRNPPKASARFSALMKEAAKRTTPCG